MYLVIMCCFLHLIFSLTLVCSESSSLLVSASDSSLETVTESGLSATFQLSGVDFLPISSQHVQASANQTFHIRLGLKEVAQECCGENVLSARDRSDDIEAMKSSSFYYRCLMCGSVVLDRQWSVVLTMNRIFCVYNCL